MKKKDFEKAEAYMRQNCEKSARAEDHIYRVLYNALNIAASEENVDLEMKNGAERFYNELYGYLDKLYSGGNSILDEYITE